MSYLFCLCWSIIIIGVTLWKEQIFIEICKAKEAEVCQAGTLQNDVSLPDINSSLAQIWRFDVLNLSLLSLYYSVMFLIILNDLIRCTISKPKDMTLKYCHSIVLFHQEGNWLARYKQQLNISWLGNICKAPHLVTPEFSQFKTGCKIIFIGSLFKPCRAKKKKSKHSHSLFWVLLVIQIKRCVAPLGGICFSFSGTLFVWVWKNSAIVTNKAAWRWWAHASRRASTLPMLGG